MDLTKYALESETDEHWAVKGPRGAFRIAKKGLGKKMRDQLEQHFAEGGQVQPDPAAVLLPSGAVQDVPSELRGSVYDPAALPGATTLEPLNPASLEPIPASLAAPPPVQTTSVLAAPSREEQLGQAVTDFTNARAAGLVPAPEPAPPSAVAPAPAVAPAAPSQRAAPAAGMGGSTQAAISKSYAESEAAAQAQVDVVKREAASTLATQQENEAKRQAAVQEWQQKTAEWQKRGDTLRDSIINQKINPNHYWESRGTGGKVSAAIGIILGGLGSGLSGGPNVALKVINDAVDRDIDAQKSNLDNKRSLLAYHMQEGHSLQAAQQLARADLLDASAAKLQMTATRYAGDKAQANAGGAIAELHRTAAITRQAVAAQNLDMQLKGLQVDATRQALAAAQGFGAGGDAQSMLARLPKEDRERSVIAPDGRIYMMARKETAEKVQEQVRGYREVVAGLNDMRTLRQKYGRAWAPFTAEKAGGQNMRDQMIGSLRLAILGPGAITDSEREIMKNIIPLPGEVYTTDDAFQAKLREVEQKASDAMWSGLTASGANLPRPRVPERKG